MYRYRVRAYKIVKGKKVYSKWTYNVATLTWTKSSKYRNTYVKNSKKTVYIGESTIVNGPGYTTVKGKKAWDGSSVRFYSMYDPNGVNLICYDEFSVWNGPAKPVPGKWVYFRAGLKTGTVKVTFIGINGRKGTVTVTVKQRKGRALDLRTLPGMPALLADIGETGVYQVNPYGIDYKNTETYKRGYTVDGLWRVKSYVDSHEKGETVYPGFTAPEKYVELYFCKERVDIEQLEKNGAKIEVYRTFDGTMPSATNTVSREDMPSDTECVKNSLTEKHYTYADGELVRISVFKYQKA